MDLYCLRHGVAVDLEAGGCVRDAERPLTPGGERKLRAVVKGMRAMNLSFDWILSSPYLRARETARIVARGLQSLDRLQLADCLAPGGSPRKTVENLCRLEPAPSGLLLVGHEPGLSELISTLVAGNPDLGIVMKKGGLCKLTIPTLKLSRCAALEWLLTPKQLIGLG